jgi:hypothetical protein
MKVLYIDEAGGVEAPNSSTAATPLMVIAGVVFDEAVISTLTSDYLHLKARFFPGKVAGARHLLDYVLAEVKGSDLRSAVRGSRNKRRHAIGFLDKVVELMESHGARIAGRIWVKDAAMNPRSSYTFAIQDIASHFEHLLTSSNEAGLMICDGRLHHQDAEVSHSIFTQKHKLAGDSFPHLVEATVFGRSQNHVGLQISDLVASALLFPMAARTYCAAPPATVHTSPHFDVIKARYGPRLRTMQHRYQDGAGRWRGGIVVSDRVGQLPSKQLFL